MDKKDRYQMNIDRVLKVSEDCIDAITYTASCDHGDPCYGSFVRGLYYEVLCSWKLLLQYYSLWPDYFKGNVLLRSQRLRMSVNDAFDRYERARQQFESEFFHDNPELPF